MRRCRMWTTRLVYFPYAQDTNCTRKKTSVQVRKHPLTCQESLIQSSEDQISLTDLVSPPHFNSHYTTGQKLAPFNPNIMYLIHKHPYHNKMD